MIIDDEFKKNVRAAHVAFELTRVAALRMHAALESAPIVDRDSILAAVSILQEVDNEMVSAYGNMVLNIDAGKTKGVAA